MLVASSTQINQEGFLGLQTVTEGLRTLHPGPTAAHFRHPRRWKAKMGTRSLKHLQIESTQTAATNQRVIGNVL